MGYCWQMVAQIMLLAALVIKFSGGIPSGMLRVDGGVTTLLAVLIIKFGGGLPAGMLLANGGADNDSGGPGHQVWRQAPCGDAAGR